MNKKSLEKIDIFTLDFTYDKILKEIFGLNNLNIFMDYINGMINDKDSENLITKLLEICWYVFIDEIIINKNNFVDFYNNVIEKGYKINSKPDKLEIIISENIKKYMIEKNNINYHKIILESI
jgi:hypothetical protein